MATTTGAFRMSGTPDLREPDRVTGAIRAICWSIIQRRRHRAKRRRRAGPTRRSAYSRPTRHARFHRSTQCGAWQRLHLSGARAHRADGDQYIRAHLQFRRGPGSPRGRAPPPPRISSASASMRPAPGLSMSCRQRPMARLAVSTNPPPMACTCAAPLARSTPGASATRHRIYV